MFSSIALTRNSLELGEFLHLVILTFFAKIAVSTLTRPQRMWGLRAQIQGFQVIFKDNKFGRKPPNCRSMRTGKASPGSNVCVHIRSGMSLRGSLKYSGSWNENEYSVPASTSKQQIHF